MDEPSTQNANAEACALDLLLLAPSDEEGKWELCLHSILNSSLATVFAMFFSNQLLCRKGPLGQIWIVATMQSKLNRKKAEQINIEEIWVWFHASQGWYIRRECAQGETRRNYKFKIIRLRSMQVLQPQVPLALRLTGILMGGIVLIYDRKVKILYEDVNDFLFKLKTAVNSKVLPPKHISLPKTKLQARFENVTITYDFDTFEDIERAMHAPATPGEEEGDVDKEEHVVSAASAADPYGRLSTSGDSKRLSNGGDHEVSPDVPTPLLNQVSSDEITLEERNGKDSLHRQYEDFGMEFPEDRIPPSDNLFMDDFFPEIQATVNIPSGLLREMPPQMHTDIEPETKPEEQQDTDQQELERNMSPQESKQFIEPEADQGAAAPENLRRHRVRGVAKRKVILDQEYTEIPAAVFASWIRDTSDIRERHKKPPTGRDPEAARAQRHLDLPSVCLLSSTCIQGLEPFWPPRLAQLWAQTLTGDVPSQAEDRREELLVNPCSPVRVSAQSSDPSNHGFEAASQDSSGPRADGVNAEISQDFMQADIASAERIPEPNGLRDYGSVEKLRAALPTPSGGSEDFLSYLFGRTPGQQQGYAKSDKSRSTPGSGFSGILPLDLERDPPTGDSGRFKRPRRSGSFRSTSPRSFENSSPGLDGVGSSQDIFANLKENQATSLSRFDLMEEIQRDTTQESMRVQVSSSLLQYLKDSFHQQGPWSLGCISLFEISEGLRREEAARLFYQICVLSSNLFVTVKQEIPYGDILLGRGIYL